MKLLRSIPFLIVITLGLISMQTNAAIGQRKGAADVAIAASPYLFVWSGDADQKHEDFLAVIDSQPDSKTFGKVIATSRGHFDRDEYDRQLRS